MEILRSTVTSSLFILGVLAFVAGMCEAEAEGSRRGKSVEEKCSKSVIQINQSPTERLPSGIPTYTVEIANTCVSGCNISEIHVACGMFSSARLINPKIFKRLIYNDCLVNDGKRFRNGAVISFKYATTFPFPLSVSSLLCG